MENNLAFPIGKQEAGLIDDFMYSDKDDEEEKNIDIILKPKEYLEQAEKYYTSLYNKEHKYQWIKCQLFNDQMKKDLETDSKELMKILQIGKNWKQENDRQLNALDDLINKKHKSEKILIFTQYSDTAYYLYEALKKTRC